MQTQTCVCVLIFWFKRVRFLQQLNRSPVGNHCHVAGRVFFSYGSRSSSREDCDEPLSLDFGYPTVDGGNPAPVVDGLSHCNPIIYSVS